MKTHIYNSILLVIVLIAISCQHKYRETWEGLRFDSTEYSISHDAEKIAITIWCTGPWTAKLLEGSDWLNLVETSGNGTSTLHCTFDKNLGLSRRGVLVVEGCGMSQEITLTHKAGIALPQIVMLSGSMTLPAGSYKIEGAFGTNIPNQYLSSSNIYFDFGTEQPWITDGVMLEKEDTLQKSSIPNGRKKFFNSTVAANHGSRHEAKIIIAMRDAARMEYKDSMTVIQTDEAPYIANPSPDMLNQPGGKREVLLSTNLTAVVSDFTLTVEYPEGQTTADFISDCKMDGRKLSYTVAPNMAAGKRYAAILISYTDVAGTRTTARLQIEQTDTPESFDNYEIKSLENLMMWNRSYSSWQSTDKITLCADIDMTGVNDWAPHEFQGTFIGNGHKIYNLCFSGVSGSRLGFFSRLSGEASVSDIILGSADGISYDGISNISISEGTASTSYIGVLAGQIAEHASVEAVRNFVAVNLDCQPTGTTCVGGITSDYSSDKDLKNCANYGRIFSRASAYSTYSVNLGGIIAQNVNTDIELSQCDNYGKIEVIYSQTCGNSVNYGGVVGYTTKSLRFNECINDGDILISPASKSLDCKDINVGGLLGYANSYTKDNATVIPVLSFEECINSGGITNYSGATANAICIGGIVGKDNAAILFNNCHNTGNIVQGENIDDVAARQIYAGGIVGKDFDNTPGEVNGCMNSGNIVVNSKSTFEGYAGGIAGSMMNSGTPIRHSDNKGTIIKNGTGAYSYFGGIVGAQQVASGTIAYCTNTADVLNNGAVTGSLRFGGIVGQVRAISIDNCTVTGSVANTSASVQGVANISAVAGYNNVVACKVSNCMVTKGSVTSSSVSNNLSVLANTDVANTEVTDNKVGGGFSVGGTVLSSGNFTNLLVAGGKAGAAIKTGNAYVE